MSETKIESESALTKHSEFRGVALA